MAGRHPEMGGASPRIRVHPRKTASEVPRRTARMYPHKMPQSPLSGIRLARLCLETIWRPMVRNVS